MSNQEIIYVVTCSPKREAPRAFRDESEAHKFMDRCRALDDYVDCVFYVLPVPLY